MNESPHTKEHLISRRASLVKAGGLVAAALGAGAWRSGAFAEESIAATDGTGPAAVAAGLVSCVLTPEQTEGPYYVEGDKVRRTITDGRAGVALTLRLTVVDASTCKAIKGAAVDVWHCDAAGVYSGVEAQKHRWPDVPARYPADEREGHRDVPDHLPRLVPRPHGAHPRARPPRRHHRSHRAALLLGRRHRRGLRAGAVQQPTRPRDPERERHVYRNGGSKSLMKLKRSGAGYIASVAMGVSRS